MYDIAYYAMAAIMAGVCCAWAVLIRSMSESFRLTPRLGGDPAASGPMVSVILPARNEEGFVERCLDSLVSQDYSSYEVVAVDDSSGDLTGEIMARYAREHSAVIHVTARPKPDGWMGKNWACMEGYRKARGELLLFTDADTVHSSGVISLAVSRIESLKLDALSLIPRMLALDFWTRAALPMITVFLHTRFSALKVNDPSKKTGYFFGSFFMMRRSAYVAVGTHEGVRGEVIEDGALGKRTKESGRPMMMLRGEHLVDAVWARDASGLWHALRRLMVPLYLQSKKIALGIFLAVAFLLFVPFPALAASVLAGPAAWPLLATAGAACAAIFAGAAFEARSGLGMSPRAAAAAPLGGLVVTAGLLAGMCGASVAWRGRTYSMSGARQDAVNV